MSKPLIRRFGISKPILFILIISSMWFVGFINPKHDYNHSLYHDGIGYSIIETYYGYSIDSISYDAILSIYEDKISILRIDVYSWKDFIGRTHFELEFSGNSLHDELKNLEIKTKSGLIFNESEIVFTEYSKSKISGYFYANAGKALGSLMIIFIYAAIYAVAVYWFHIVSKYRAKKRGP